MVITNKFKNNVVYWLGGSTNIRPLNVAVGLGSTVLDEDDNALNDEAYPTTSRNPTIISRNQHSLFYKMNISTTQGDIQTYREIGLFTNSTTGDMFAAHTHPDIDDGDRTTVDSIFSLEVGSYIP